MVLVMLVSTTPILNTIAIRIMLIFVQFLAEVSLCRKMSWRIFPLNIKYRRNTFSR